MNIIISILLYYFVFFIAYKLFKMSDRAISKRRAIVFLLIGILVICLFAGLRGEQVGIDTYRTVLYRFRNVNSSSSLSTVLARGISEPVLIIIPYFIKKIINDYRAFLFVLELLTVLPIGIVAYKLRNRASIHITMLVYMLLFFQISLNVAKQSIAAAWLLLALLEFLEKKYIKAIIIMLLSTYFHGSVIIGVTLFLLIYFMFTSGNKVLTITLSMFSFIAFMLVIMNWQSLFETLISRGILPEDYTGYLNLFSGDVESSKVSFHFRTLVSEMLRIFGTFIMLFYLRGMKDKYMIDIRVYQWSMIISLVFFSTFVIVLNTYLGDRFTLYLDYCQIPLYALMIGRKEIPYNNRKFSRERLAVKIPVAGPSLCLTYCFIFNLFMFMIIGYGNTVPYNFG